MIKLRKLRFSENLGELLKNRGKNVQIIGDSCFFLNITLQIIDLIGQFVQEVDKKVFKSFSTS